MTETATFDHLLLGVGAMKAGTTWMYDALNRHPDIHFCREKEVHYLYARHVNASILSDAARMRRAQGYLRFDPEASALPVLQKRVAWTARWLDGAVDDTWFKNLYRDRGAARWIADFSNMNALVPEEGWAALHARTRKLRVLYTLRDPLDRLWSHVRFHLKVQGASEKLNVWSLDELERHIRHDVDYLAHNDYVAAIERMRAALPRDCLRIDVFDRIRAEPRAFIADIERFLELPAVDLPDRITSRVVNPSPPRPLPEGLAARFAEDVARQIDGLKSLGVAVPETWGQTFR
ncbi:sulfotransferase [Gymnodinialimonas ceratoperidinii]|uniref:Sulfotransferase n=1 Tax=Gymnodinialimonas ceratoperidinii TaxID=2856823 RepID=A0A8F6YCT0_9RHOB|nr:sulfotransferase [Gymnodinialimonas ceratoperidinii]QXT39517.1 sulfotransferase [Gymnodinialimonas ceratoperidinii]